MTEKRQGDFYPPLPQIRPGGSATSSTRKRSAAVVFDTRFGSTERVAKALEAGLKEAGMETMCINARGMAPESLKQFDLICVGGPTEEMSASKPMKEFLRSSRGINLAGRFAFAFDTKLESHLSGSAARYIEHELDDQGLHLVLPRESALVQVVKQKGSISGASLREGEEARFERLGFRVGTAAAADMARITYAP